MKNQSYFLAIAIATVTLGAAHADPRYSVSDLGTLGGNYSSARAISANGFVTGIARDASGQDQPFLYSGGHMQGLGSQSGSVAGNGVNASGDVAADASVSAQHHALRYHGGRFKNIGDLGGGQATAYAINAQGNIVGSARTADGHDEPFLFDNNAMVDLGTLGGRDAGQWNVASGVSDQRAVTGTSWDANGRYRAFLWRNGAMASLGTLGGTWSEGSAINNHNQVTGLAYLPGDSAAHAFLWKNNHMKDLGVLANGVFSWGFGLNDNGVVVGLCQQVVNGAYVDRAVIVESRAMQDLNDLIAAGSGWSLDIAYGINDDGRIVGEGTIGGQVHAFLLTPN